MSFEVASLTVTYDGRCLRVHARLHPHGARDLGVTPVPTKGAAVPVEDVFDGQAADDLAEMMHSQVAFLARQFAGAWGGTPPLF